MTFKIADGHVCPKANTSNGVDGLADDAVNAGCCLAELGCWSLGCLLPILAGLLVAAFLHA